MLTVVCFVFSLSDTSLMSSIRLLSLNCEEIFKKDYDSGSGSWIGGEIYIFRRPFIDTLSAETVIFVETGALYSGGSI